jgi:RNA polymerase sigma-70 factor, ECF subfamily
MIQLLPRLRSFARGLTGTVDQADDLVQQTVEKGLRNIGSYTPGTRLDSWLFRIMRNSWIDAIRARRDSQPLDEGPGLTLVAEDGRVTTETRLYLQDVQRAMADLPEDQRSVLMLVCVEGMRYREVAEALEIPEGTVMSRLARARAALAVRLKQGPGAARSKGLGR